MQMLAMKSDDRLQAELQKDSKFKTLQRSSECWLNAINDSKKILGLGQKKQTFALQACH